MPKPQECKNCQKAATIHLTQIIDGKVTKIDLCEDCVHKEKYVGELAFGQVEKLAEGLKQAVAEQMTLAKAPPCPECGIRLEEIGKNGRAGCPACYDHFADALVGWVEKVQGTLGHEGKIPAHASRRAVVRNQSDTWQRELARAVAEERYEDAAALRDQLRTLEKEQDE